MAKKENGFFAEFKKFIMRGNVIDLAVGVIIGGAFQAIVNSLVDDIVMPLIGLILGNVDFTTLCYKFGEGENTAVLNYGNFITAVLNFLIMALVIFTIIRTINKVSDKFRKKEEEPVAEPTTKVCPFCKSEIAIDATKCPHCTSELE